MPKILSRCAACSDLESLPVDLPSWNNGSCTDCTAFAGTNGRPEDFSNLPFLAQSLKLFC